MNTFNWKDFEKGNLAVKFNTKDDYVTFLQKCEGRNIRWINGELACECIDYWETRLSLINHAVVYSREFGGLACQDLYSCQDLHNGTVAYYYPNEQSINIIIKDNKTIASLYNDGIKTVGIAKCNPIDDFDFETGAKLALQRCFEKRKQKQDLKNKFKISDKVKIIDTNGRFSLYTDFVKVFAPELLNRFDIQISVSKDKTYTIVGYGKHLDLDFAIVYPNHLYIIQDEDGNVFVFYEDCLEKAKELKIYSNGIEKGIVGKKISQTALFGEELFVGDIVELYDTDRGIICGEYIVCQYEAYPDGFILGVGGAVFKDGISDDWQIRKVKSYTELKKGSLSLDGYRYLEIRD